MADEIQEAFEAFHAQNPDVYRKMVEGARDLWRRGYRRASISLIWERMRWEMLPEIAGPEEEIPRLNNNFRSRYVRLFEEEHPNMHGFFRTRRLRSETVNSTWKAREDV